MYRVEQQGSPNSIQQILKQLKDLELEKEKQRKRIELEKKKRKKEEESWRAYVYTSSIDHMLKATINQNASLPISPKKGLKRSTSPSKGDERGKRSPSKDRSSPSKGGVKLQPIKENSDSLNLSQTQEQNSNIEQTTELNQAEVQEIQETQDLTHTETEYEQVSESTPTKSPTSKKNNQSPSRRRSPKKKSASKSKSLLSQSLRFRDEFIRNQPSDFHKMILDLTTTEREAYASKEVVNKLTKEAFDNSLRFIASENNEFSWKDDIINDKS